MAVASPPMDYTNPFLNALLAALLGVLVVVWWSWGLVARTSWSACM